MEILSRNGAQYRTKLTRRSQADRFARCLKANPHFTGVMVYESARTEHPEIRWYVVYHPTNPERTAAILQRFQDAREQRAEEQRHCYQLLPDPDAECPTVLTLNLVTGAFYETTLGDCGCPDFQHRLRGSGCRCKHMVLLARAVETGELVFPMDRPESVPAAAVTVYGDPFAQSRRDRELLWS